MTVYVDAARWPYRGMLMNHMMADTEEELHAMADSLGLRREWHQGDHYDISWSKRAEAIRLGAVEVDTRFLVELRRAARPGGQEGGGDA